MPRVESHGAQAHDVFIGAAVAQHGDSLYRQQHREGISNRLTRAILMRPIRLDMLPTRR